MRDNILVEAQNQLDAMASAMSQALSDETIDGDPRHGRPAGGLRDRHRGLARRQHACSLTYIDNQTGQQRRVTIVRVDDPGALPLSNAATTDPNDEVIGVDFSAGFARW